MNDWILAFIGAGVVLAVIGAAIVLFNWKKEDQGLRQSGWVIFVAGLAMAAMTWFAAGHPRLDM